MLRRLSLMGLVLVLPGTPPANAAPPVSRLRVSRLPPAWVSASTAQAHSLDGLPKSPGGLKVRPIAAAGGADCLRELVRLRIPFRGSPPVKGIATPVIVTGPINGLKFAPMWGRKPALMDCRFALHMYQVAPAVLRTGITEIRYSSFYSYRNVAGTTHLSRHSYGLAIDIFEIRNAAGLRMNVKKDWQHAIGTPGDCVGKVTSQKARYLRALSCALEETRKLHLVLTPDSDYAHRDHFHVSGFKPGESTRRKRYRYAGRILGSKGIPYRAINKRYKRGRRYRRSIRKYRRGRRHRRRPRIRRRPSRRTRRSPKRAKLSRRRRPRR